MALPIFFPLPKRASLVLFSLTRLLIFQDSLLNLSIFSSRKVWYLFNRHSLCMGLAPCLGWTNSDEWDRKRQEVTSIQWAVWILGLREASRRPAEGQGRLAREETYSWDIEDEQELARWLGWEEHSREGDEMCKVPEEYGVGRGRVMWHSSQDFSMAEVGRTLRQKEKNWDWRGRDTDCEMPCKIHYKLTLCTT